MKYRIALTLLLLSSLAYAGGQIAVMDPITKLGKVIKGGTGIDVNGATGVITATGTATPGIHATTHASGGTDPVTPVSIGAATAAQGLLAETAVQPTVGVDFYPASDNSHAAIEIDQTITSSTDDRQGAIHASTQATTTHTGSAANWFEFISTGNLTGGFDIASTHIMRSDSIGNGGTAGAQWWVAATPKTNTGNYAVYGGEINTLNAYADMGYQENLRTAIKPVSGLFLVPESELNVGRGLDRGYHSTYGLMFGRSVGTEDVGAGRTYPAAKWWIPLMISTDSTVPTGTSLMVQGGSTAPNAPSKAIKVMGYQGDGFDTTAATFSGAAIKLKGGQTIADDAGNSVTVAQLTTAVGGGATDGDAIHKGGSGEIAVVSTKTTPASTDYLLIEDPLAGNAKSKITIGSLNIPSAVVTSVSSTNADIAVTGTTAPQLTLNSGTGANQIAKMTAGGNLLAGTSTDKTDTRMESAIFDSLAGVSFNMRYNTAIESSSGASVLYRRARNNLTTPHRLKANDFLVSESVEGAYAADDATTATYDAPRGFLQVATTEAWTTTGRGYYLMLKTRTNGTTGAPTERLRVTDAGRILIGAPSDDGTTALQVNGAIKTTGITGITDSTVVANLHATNSDALNGHADTYFLTVTATAADSDKLDGQHGSYYAKANGSTHTQGTSSTLDLDANDGFRISASGGTVNLTLNNLVDGKYFDIEIISTSGSLTLNAPLFTGATFPNGNNSTTVSAGKSSHYACKGTGTSTAKCYTLTESK